LEIEVFAKGHEYLYFPCCALAYDPELGGIARATARILMGFGTRFGTLGVKESCCGESVRKAGNINLFDTLAKSNTEAFLQSGVEKIIVSSPHCYTIFNDEHHRFGADLQVIHLTQYLARLLKEEKITYRKELSKTVVYHDPCYLGRHSGIYEEPRNVLNSIPGLQLLDEIDSRENSLCCGGGGGRIWMETKKGERFSDILVAQAIDQGADILATACPYCILNFKDSVRTSGKGDILEIKDISEIVYAVI
jgi:Fe-S oxidoreductase